MEDRSSNYKGYGRIQEGDLTLTVAMLLRTRLQELGADVFVIAIELSRSVDCWCPM